jgi:hypothetical protein
MNKGKTLIKVAGIIMIVLGAIAAIGCIGIIALGGAVVAYSSEVVGGGALALVGVIGLIVALIELVFGILGVKFCDKPEKAQVIIVIGAVLVGLQVISLIISLVTGGSSGATLAGSVVGCILPILYIVGGLKNKESLIAPPQNSAENNSNI